MLDFAEIARRLTGGTFDVHNGRRTAPAPSIRPESSRAGRPPERPAPLAALGLDYYLNAGGDVLLRSVGSDSPGGSASSTPTIRVDCSRSSNWPNGAVATSGRTHRGEHIWNPATGRPASGIAQATVIGPSLVWADVLATAVVAGGLERLDHASVAART